MKYKKKLIEVALPLEAINVASAREKSIRHGHPSTLHLWWARRPLATARAVLFAQMVDDPSGHPDIFKTEKAQEKERQRLFKIIESLVKWESTTDEAVLQTARDEIWQSWRYTCAENADHPLAKEIFDRFKLPGFHDPFAGGGAIPLEAQRLGLESFASDLNPVAIAINKAMIELPQKFLNKEPVNPDSLLAKTHMDKSWSGSMGLAEDIRYYGNLLSKKAERKIGKYYPEIEITQEMTKERPDLEKYIGQKLTVMAWVWARTVKSPNPAYSEIDIPLASSFMLSTKAGKGAYIEPIVTGDGYVFKVKIGEPQDSTATKLGTSAGKRAGFKCLMSGIPVPYEYIRKEGQAGRMGAKLMAIIAEGERGRIYLDPTEEIEKNALEVKAEWRPDCELPLKHRNFQPPGYGLTNLGDLFTNRQLVTLTTFSSLIDEVRTEILSQAAKNGWIDDGIGIDGGGLGAKAYAEVVSVYLAFAVNKLADRGSTICGWDSSRDSLRNTFGRQAIPMVWDFAEANPFSDSSGSYENALIQGAKVVNEFYPAKAPGSSVQADAAVQTISVNKVISTDPPYYDNICYADLSDFFYVWLRLSLKKVFPDLFSTLEVPKIEELVATANRHGSKDKAEKFFLSGMTLAMHKIAEQSHPAFPVTIYYAFKQSENSADDGTTNTGWDTFLSAVIKAGFEISGTWPVRTELSNRMIGSGANALASSIVLVCRKRPLNAINASFREFKSELKKELPNALILLQAGNIAPVDLAQASIGPGMAVYTRYSKVLDSEGNTLSIRSAIALINQTLDEALAEQESDFDADTRWALTWFDQVGFSDGDFGLATVLAQAKVTGMDRLVEAGIVVSGKGNVRLIKPNEFPSQWSPDEDSRLTIWGVLHHLIRLLESSGEGVAAEVVSKLGTKAEIARELCYRLYTLCERKKRATEAMSYNGLVQSWPEIIRLARQNPPAVLAGTADLFEQE
jgi:putative DNA methylase